LVRLLKTFKNQGFASLARLYAFKARASTVTRGRDMIE